MPDLVVYNASYRTRGPFTELDPKEVEKTLSISAYAGFLVAQAAAKRMLPRGAGAIFFTGASASVKGYANSAPFAMGKFALRGLAQSMARELAPKGIHVAHFVIDGGIGKDAGDAKLDPDEIAQDLPCRLPPAPQRMDVGSRIAPVGGALLKFVYNGLPMRVVFGAGSLSQLPSELERLGAKRALVLSTPEQAASASEVAKALGSRAAGTYDKAAMHVPLEIAEDARRVARELGADCCVTVGGGSTTGLGKAIALTSPLPILAVPTTYAGSEMTPIYGITEGGAKKTGRDVRVLPKAVIYDPSLTLSLPPALSAASGMNAIAHSVEALYAQDANPVISLMAEEGIRALATALPVDREEPERPRSEDGSALRRLALRRRARLGRDGAAPQALPRARRQLQPAARRDAFHRAAARHALQLRGRARGDDAGGARDWQRLRCRRDIRSGKRTRTADAACRSRHERSRPRARGAHRHRGAVPES